MIRTILFIISFVVLGLSVVFLIINNANKEKKDIKDFTKDKKEKGNKNKLLAATIIISTIFAIFVPGSFYQVEAGQVAVVKTLGQVKGIRFPGTHFDFCLVSQYIYFDTTVQQLDIDTASYSSDAQTMNIKMTVQYKIDADKAKDILVEYNNMDSLSKRIEKVTDDKTKAVLSRYTAMKIIETRSTISLEVEQAVKEAVGDKYYVSVTAVNLTNIDFTAEFEKSVEDKVIAEQQKEAAITKAEQELEVAKLEAQAKIEAARGDAESQKIIASASAEAMAIKLVELAKSIGFEVNETYIKKIETTVMDYDTKEVISETTLEEEVIEKPEVGVVTNLDEETKQLTTITTSISSTKYSIVFDETHTKEDLNIVTELVKYLEYLEKWNGELPNVVTSSSGVDVIIPSING